jgi:hypothetical protein
VNADTQPWRALRRISQRLDMLSPMDRELLRPALVALEGGQVMALPTMIIARIRDIDARLPRQQQ